MKTRASIPAMSTAAIPNGVTVIDHPLARVKLTRMRDIATTPREVRARLAELATLLVYEATRDLDTRIDPIRTPLADFDGTAWAVALHVVLPAGISFYTFQTLSYVIDLYRGHAKPE